MTSARSTFPLDFTLPNTRESISDAAITHCESGLTRGRLNLSEQEKRDIGDITLKTTSTDKERGKTRTKRNLKSDDEKSSMLGLAREGSQMTSNTKLNFSELNSLLTTLSGTLGRDLTITEKDFDKSWTTRIGENSRRLWLPTKTDCVDGDSKSSKICLSMFQGQKLLSSPSLKVPLNKNCARTLSQSSPCLPPVYMVNEGMGSAEESEEQNCFKTRKYRILLPRNKEEKQKVIDQLENDFGAFRWYCNFTLDAILPAFQEALTVRDIISPQIQEIEAAHAVRKSIVTSLLKGYKTVYRKEDWKELGQLAADEKKTINKECYAEKREVYHQYRFYRMCKGATLDYQTAKQELKHSVLNGTVQNSRGQTCNVVEENYVANCLPIPEWMQESEFKVHNRVPRGALKKTIQDIKSAFSNWRNGNIRSFQFSRRTKKQDRQVLHFEDKDIPKYIKNLEMVYRHGRKIVKRNPEFTAGCELIHDKLDDKYYMMIPEKYVPTPLTDENQVCLNEKTIVFDEGIRAFLSGYVPGTCTVEFGTDTSDLLKILVETDQLRQEISGSTDSAFKSELWIKIRKLNRRLKNKITDLHWKICRFLSLNFKTVIIPKFPVKEIARALGFNHQAKRLLLLFSHYAFKQRLAFKAKENGFQTFLVGEAWTSQTCGGCQHLHKTRSKTYKCPHCKIVIDRDLNGARNILLKFLYEMCHSLSGLNRSGRHV
jgi:transposase